MDVCSTLYIVDFAGVAAKTMVTTTIAAGSGAITTVIITKVMSHYYDAGAANNGVLAGLVGITAGCSTCEPEGAFVIGVIAGFVYVAFSKALVMLKVRKSYQVLLCACCAGGWRTTDRLAPGPGMLT